MKVQSWMRLDSSESKMERMRRIFLDFNDLLVIVLGLVPVLVVAFLVLLVAALVDLGKLIKYTSKLSCVCNIATHLQTVPSEVDHMAVELGPVLA